MILGKVTCFGFLVLFVLLLKDVYLYCSFIGSTHIIPDAVGVKYVPLAFNEQIPVEPGDLIAFRYIINGCPIKYQGPYNCGGTIR